MTRQASNLTSQIPKIILGIGIWSLVIAAPIVAQTSSPSANPIRDAVKEKVQQELDQIKKAVAKRGFVGTITAKSDSTLTLTNLKSQPRTVAVPADTTIKLSGGKEGTFADLKVDTFILVMGDVDSQNVMTAKRLLVLAKPVPDKRKAVLGTVTKTSSSSLSVTTVTKDALTVKITSATAYTAKTKLANIAVGDKVVVVGTSTDSTTLSALLVHLLVP